MDEWSERLLQGSGYDRSGFPEGFDANRPSPPEALVDLLCLEAQVARPSLVVDLGSGTGLSTRLWAGRADQVVGVEASPEMREHAERATRAENVRFEPGVGGRLVEVHDAATGEGRTMGDVTVWEPGARLVFVDRRGTEVDAVANFT